MVYRKRDKCFFFSVILMKDIQNANMCVIMSCVSASIVLSYLHSRLHCYEKDTFPPANKYIIPRRPIL
ncbi:hypothetical protein M441DRAFT_387002 [Trichoderma asperellum CBS 433.97]|uniref:Uncharacterized protein n=1 Tax=Trichoderma asperellum (strain ATCC 204424 / CBS 433.97 / NBRC 101777) TaxID=1042311 RepID=A0A2T3ZBS4_TRIA4|nr:hypothetical protein M441DRAFT_387002 [Trichoderma asperellum CBS 433.97]PTB42257.1 hypothetical protein M441DRAFT_387002 [Trichoderma asperellum CBS 433.97]